MCPRWPCLCVPKVGLGTAPSLAREPPGCVVCVVCVLPRTGPGTRILPVPPPGAEHPHPPPAARPERSSYQLGEFCSTGIKMVKAGREARGSYFKDRGRSGDRSQAAAFDGSGSRRCWPLARGGGMWPREVGAASGMASPHLAAWVAPGSAFPSPGMDSVRAGAVTHERQTSNPSVRDAGLSGRGADPVLEASCSQLACELHPCVPCKSC